MLQVKDISISFGERKVLQDLSFNIADGDKVGLVGDNGAGKTTLMRIITGEIRPDSGEVVLTRQKKSDICYIPQHLSLHGIEREQDVLTFMLEGRGLNKIRNMLAKIDALLRGPLGQARLEELMNERVRLEEKYLEKEGYRAENDIKNILSGIGLGSIRLNQKVVTLSGGQKSRLALARLLFDKSKVMLLDEPTNHIDEEAALWLSNYLSYIPQTVLVISHMADFLDKVVKRILFLDGQTGEMKSYPGNYTQFLSLSEKEGITTSRTIEKLENEIARQKAFIQKSAIQSKAKQMHSREKVVERLEKKVPKQIKQRKINVAFPVKTPLNKLVINAREICKSFGDKRVLDKVSLEATPTARVGVIGENGAGKTTLLRILTGAIESDSGSITRSRNLEIGWYRQDIDDLTDSNTVMEEIEALGFGKIDKLRSALAHFLFRENKLHQKVGSLSRGERARLALCKLVLSRPNLLVLDEPTNHLDESSRASLMAGLAAYQGAIVIVSHDTDFLIGIGVEWALYLPSGKAVRIAEIDDSTKARLGK